MELKVAATSLHWSQPSVPHSPSSSQTLASAISSPSSKRRSFINGDGVLFCRYAERSALFFGAHKSSKLYRSRSCDNRRSQVRIMRRALTACLDSSSDEEFSKENKMSKYEDDGISRMDESAESRLRNSNAEAKFLEDLKPFDAIEPPNFPERDEIILSSIERKANSVDIPLSLRIIKRKKQWQEGFSHAGSSAYCSVKKAFSSMVFIIRELHSYTMQMREVLFYQDLQGILASVQREMHASFVWLFQKVFSHTPTLMVYVMILLANYSVYSMSSAAAIAPLAPVQSYAVTSEEVSVVEDQSSAGKQKFDSSIVRTLKLSSSNGKTASVGGNNGGGGGKFWPVASGTDGDGIFDESNHYGTITPDGTSTSGEESVSREVTDEEEMNLWNSIVEEASRMQAESRDEALDQETMQKFVSPVEAKIEADDRLQYLETELFYRVELAHESSDPLLLANYAQFLYLVVRDFDRAEDYFKKATNVEPKDAEALSKYANFLWLARKDLWAAEETYLEAISAAPDNSYYAANYAHFLWNTGGEDTCFPLSSPESNTDV